MAACPFAEICNYVKNIGITHGGSPGIRVQLTTSAVVPYGSLFCRFFWLYFE